MTITAATLARSMTERFVTGEDADKAVAQEASRRGAQRVFLMAGNTLNRETDEISRISAKLGSAHAVTFSSIGAHAPVKDIVDAINAARDAKADMIVTVGGGAITDSGKIVALGLKAGTRSVADVEELWKRYTWGAGEAAPETAPDVKVVCVPTTLSGGELNHVAGATHDDLGKIGFEHLENAPATIIYDPKLTRHTPEWLWLSTGVRSIDHAVEALASTQSNEYCDAIADTALRLLADGLRRSKANPLDFEARLRCQIGAWQSMVPILNGVPMGAGHSIGHGLGSYAHVPHGHTSCVLLPVVQKWNAEVVPERLARVSAALGDADRPAHELLDELIRGIGQPRSLAEVGVENDEAVFAKIADYAMTHPWGRTNPRRIDGPAEVMEILRLAAAQ